MVLFINACTRKESRTKRLAKELLRKLNEDFEEISLYYLDIKPFDEEMINLRNNLIGKNDYSHKMFDLSKKVANADKIVIAAPYYDLSFPSILKIFIENIYCVGIVSEYNENGMPIGLCKASNLYYVVTAGGPYNKDYSYEYIKDLFINYFGVKECELIYADMLDVAGYDSNKILENKIKELDTYEIRQI